MRKLLLLVLLLSINIPAQAFHVAIDPHASRLEQLIVHGESILGEGWEIVLSDGRETYGYVAWHDGNNAIINIQIVRFANMEDEYNYFHYNEDMIPYFDIILANYMPHELLNSCSEDDLTLHEFTGHSADITYDIQIYHRAIGTSIVRTVGLYFPVERSEDLTEYATRFYPDLLTCPD